MFTLVRWIHRQEPPNSDDLNYFSAASRLIDGTHAVFVERPLKNGALHHDYRFGVVLPSALAQLLFGANSRSYYMVPACFSLAAFCAVFLLNRSLVGMAAAVLVGLLQCFWALEIAHGSVLFADLGAATCLLAAIGLSFPNELHLRASQTRFAPLAAGVFIFFGYLFRENLPALYAPTVLFLMWRKEDRRRLLQTLTVSALLFSAEQALYLWLGASPLHRHVITSEEIERYKPYFPRADLIELPLRTFSELNRKYGWANAFLALFSLFAAFAGLIFGTTRLQRTVGCTALLSWCIMTFLPLGTDDGRLLVMPVQPRLLGTLTLFGFVSATPFVAKGLRSRTPTRVALVGVLACVVLVETLALGKLPRPLYGERSRFHPVLKALDQEAGTKQIVATGRDLNEMRLFKRGLSGEELRWHWQAPSELLEDVRNATPKYVYVNTALQSRDWRVKGAARTREWTEQLYQALSLNYRRLTPKLGYANYRWLFERVPTRLEKIDVVADSTPARFDCRDADAELRLGNKDAMLPVNPATVGSTNIILETSASSVGRAFVNLEELEDEAVTDSRRFRIRS
ncbi:MAG: hypothetical protein AAF658_12570, partial [Myxococcota bacterium]